MKSLRLAAIPILFALTVAACGSGKSTVAASTTVTPPVAAVDVRSTELQLKVQEINAKKASQLSFVGKIDGTDAYIAIVQQGNDIVAYSCDGGTVALWLKGTVTADTANATHPSGATLTAKKGPNGFTGSLVAGGVSKAFSTTVAAYPAGLWETFGDEPNIDAHYGWIVLGDGTQRGAKTQLNTVSGAGDVNIASNSGDGIAVGGPPPPPTPPVANDAPLSAELCGLIQKQGIFYSDRYFDEQDRAKKGAYLVKFRNAESLFNDGGCKTTLGQNVMGGKVGV